MSSANDTRFIHLCSKALRAAGFDDVNQAKWPEVDIEAMSVGGLLFFPIGTPPGPCGKVAPGLGLDRVARVKMYLGEIQALRMLGEKRACYFLTNRFPNEGTAAWTLLDLMFAKKVLADAFHIDDPRDVTRLGALAKKSKQE